VRNFKLNVAFGKGQEYLLREHEKLINKSNVKLKTLLIIFVTGNAKSLFLFRFFINLLHF
jgi:hypothetical protein